MDKSSLVSFIRAHRGQNALEDQDVPWPLGVGPLVRWSRLAGELGANLDWLILCCSDFSLKVG